MAATGVRRSSGQERRIPFRVGGVGSLDDPRRAVTGWAPVRRSALDGLKGEVQTFADLIGNVAKIAAGLEALGIAKGDRVGLFLGNRFEWLQIEYAVTALGAALVPLNTALRARELDHIVRTSEMNLLVWGSQVVGHDTLPLLQSLVPEISDARSENGTAVDPGTTSGNRRRRRRMAARRPPLEPDHCVRSIRWSAEHPENVVTSDDVALIMFTSGTTGAPKGALLTHGAIVDHLAHWSRT